MVKSGISQKKYAIEDESSVTILPSKKLRLIYTNLVNKYYLLSEISKIKKVF